MRFLLDMGVSLRVALHLRAAGHDAVHLREEGLQRLPNGEIFQMAHRESRCVLTFDLDFGEIVAGSAGKLVSVVLFRLHNTRADHVIARLERVLQDSRDELESGAIVVVEDARHRVRKLPLGS
jgi:predicted nuclease of predicted toxin-antitoxin system